jgi:hypothetical protein
MARGYTHCPSTTGPKRVDSCLSAGEILSEVKNLSNQMVKIGSATGNRTRV